MSDKGAEASAYIADFGSATKLRSATDTLNFNFGGTEGYIAPETSWQALHLQCRRVEPGLFNALPPFREASFPANNAIPGSPRMASVSQEL